MGRAPCCDKTKVKRGPWSSEEDTLLKNFIHSHGTAGNWITLPHKAGLNRCGKSCRLRWLNYLRPDIKHGGFTEEEDFMICSLYSALGSRWAVIASKLQGRTDNDVKNYWNTKLRKKIMAGKVPGLEPRSICKVAYNTNCTDGLLQSSLNPFTEMKPTLETNAYDYGVNSVASYSSAGTSFIPCSLGNRVLTEQTWDRVQVCNGISQQETSGHSELQSSRCSSASWGSSIQQVGGGGREDIEDDIDDFWLKLLADQSTFVGGVSQSLNEKINEFASVLGGHVSPSKC